MSTISSTEQPIPRAVAASASPWTGPAWAGGVLLVIVVAMFFDFFRRQFLWGITESEDWGHTLVIPLIAGYFIYLRRKELLAQPFKTTWIGLLPVALGVAWYLECTIGVKTLQNHNLQGLGVYITLNGLALLFCGWRAMRWLWFPLAFLFVFGQKMPVSLMNKATYPMQDITARGAHVMLSLFLDVDRQGNTINIFWKGKNIPLNIAEACSGMRMLMAFLALGVAMAYTGLKHTWQRVLLVMLAVPTSIFVNILRVVTLGLLSLIDPELAAGDVHAFIGLLWLIPAFFIFLGLMWIISNLVTEEGRAKVAPPVLKAVAATSPFDRRVKPAFIIVGLLLAGTWVGFTFAVQALNIYLQKYPVEMRSPFANIARTLDPWQAVGDDRVMDPAIVLELGTDKYLDRNYARHGVPAEGVISVHLAYYTGMIDAVPHVPDRCFVAAGFEKLAEPSNLALPLDVSKWRDDTELRNHSTGLPYPLMAHRSDIHGTRMVRMPLGEWFLRTTEFKDERSPDSRIYSGYLFIANGRVTPSPERVRLLAFEKSEKYAYYCKVQFTMAGRELTPERFLAHCAELTGPLLPELMQKLPDWSEVERRDEVAKAAASK